MNRNSRTMAKEKELWNIQILYVSTLRCLILPLSRIDLQPRLQIDMIEPILFSNWVHSA